MPLEDQRLRDVLGEAADRGMTEIDIETLKHRHRLAFVDA
jgi:hypothetical protein